MISQNCGEAINLGIFYHGIAAKRLPLPLLVGPFYKSLLMSFADVDDAKPGLNLEMAFRADRISSMWELVHLDTLLLRL